MDKIFIFDYDDTLAWCHIDYSLTEVRFLEFVLGRLGSKSPDPDVILDKLDSIDVKNVKTLGFSKRRYPTTIMEVYRWICGEARIEDKEGEELAYNIGASVFDEERWRKRGLVEGAEETLDFLVMQKDKLMILTKGDPEIQPKKMRATGVKKWFGEDIYVVPDKTPKVFSDLIDGYDKSRIWMVGNSEKSDVLPAIANGVKAIYIPYETWSVEEVKRGLPESPLITRFEKIIEIKEKYDILK